MHDPAYGPRGVCVRLCATSRTAARQSSLSVGVSRQGYRSGLPCFPPGDLPNPGTEPASLMLFTKECPPRKPGTPHKSLDKSSFINTVHSFWNQLTACSPRILLTPDKTSVNLIVPSPCKNGTKPVTRQWGKTETQEVKIHRTAPGPSNLLNERLLSTGRH